MHGGANQENLFIETYSALWHGEIYTHTPLKIILEGVARPDH